MLESWKVSWSVPKIKCCTQLLIGRPYTLIYVSTTCFSSYLQNIKEENQDNFFDENPVNYRNGLELFKITPNFLPTVAFFQLRSRSRQEIEIQVFSDLIFSCPRILLPLPSPPPPQELVIRASDFFVSGVAWVLSFHRSACGMQRLLRNCKYFRDKLMPWARCFFFSRT